MELTATPSTRTSTNQRAATRDPEATATLHRLLDAEPDWSPIARGGYISHLAMGLVAASRLGATDDRLGEQFRAATAGDFLIPRERPDALAPLTAEVVDRGVEAVVADRLQMLVDHPGAQLFHAVIRLDLAIDSGHAGQVANALLNWSADSKPPTPPPSGSGYASFAEVMARVSAGDRSAIDDLHCGDGLLDAMTIWVASVHDDPGNFGTLHYVTGTRAVRAVAGFLADDDRRRLALAMARALVAATDRFGPSTPPSATELDRRRALSLPDWSDLGAAALATGDPHVIKLTYACLLEERTDGDVLHRWVAARQNHLV